MFPDGTQVESVDFCTECWQKGSCVSYAQIWYCSLCGRKRFSGVLKPLSVHPTVIGYGFRSGYALCKPCHTIYTPSGLAWPQQLDGHGPMHPLYWKAEYVGGLSCCFCQRQIVGWW